MIDWLAKNRLVNIGILAFYYLSVVLPHKHFGTFLNTRVFKGLTRTEYNHLALSLGLLVLVVYLIIFFYKSRSKEQRLVMWFYLGINLVLACLALNILFVINIELIHFPQYALFAILLFPIIGNYRSTLIWSTMAGALDEGFQYFVLAPNDTNYFDFNDVVCNLLGAVFGLLLIWSLGGIRKNSKSFHKSSAFYGILFLILLFVILYMSQTLSIYPSDRHSFQLMQEVPSQFWSKVHPNVTYHVIRPIEGMIITLTLWVFYYRLG